MKDYEIFSGLPDGKASSLNNGYLVAADRNSLHLLINTIDIRLQNRHHPL